MEKIKNAAIIGATGGIGREVSFKIASMGFRIILVARKRDKLAELCESIKRINANCDFVAADISKQEEIERLFKFIEDKYGWLDVLVNCAGRAAVCDIDNMRAGLWDELMDVNAKAVFLASIKGIGLMKKKGKGNNYKCIIGCCC